MKKLLILLSFLSLSPVMAKTTIIECLGKEELILHKTKSTGPLYRLNQFFINEVSTLQSLSLKESYFEKVCGPKIKTSPSLGLLYYGLTDGMNIYAPIDADKTPSHRFILAEMERMIESLPGIFFEYLSQIQAQAPSAGCLKTQIPELSALIYEYRYVGEDLDKRWIKTKKKEVTKIFEKLHHLKAIFAACQKEVNKKKNQPTN